MCEPSVAGALMDVAVLKVYKVNAGAKVFRCVTIRSGRWVQVDEGDAKAVDDDVTQVTTIS